MKLSNLPSVGFLTSPWQKIAPNSFLTGSSYWNLHFRRPLREVRNRQSIRLLSIQSFISLQPSSLDFGTRSKFFRVTFPNFLLSVPIFRLQLRFLLVWIWVSSIPSMSKGPFRRSIEQEPTNVTKFRPQILTFHVPSILSCATTQLNPTIIFSPWRQYLAMFNKKFKKRANGVWLRETTTLLFQGIIIIIIIQ